MYTTWGVVSVYIAKSKQLQKPLIEGLRKWIAFASYNQIFTIFLISNITKVLAGRGVVRDNYLLVAFVKSRE